MSIFRRTRKLSNDPDTGQSTINGQPASNEEVSNLMHQNGFWDAGEFIVEEEQPAEPPTRTTIAARHTRRGLFG